jgi:Outer membrane protein beta-barrel domain
MKPRIPGCFCIASILFLLCYSNSGYCQNSFVRKFNIGFEGGLNFSTKVGAEDIPHTRIGGRGGLSSFKFITQKFFISSGISFVYDVAESRTSYNRTSGIFTPHACNITLTEHNYWGAIPLFCNYVFAEKMNKKYFAGLGIEGRYLFRSKATLIAPAVLPNGDPTTIEYDDVDIKSKRYNTLLLAGARIGYITHIFARDKFMFALTYQLGVTCIVRTSQNENASTIYDDKAYHLGSLTFSANYLF